jgi:predicted permease
MSTASPFETVARDLRYAVRMLRKTPGFTIIALITLAVGIGVNTAVFTVVNALLLNPLPFPKPERLAAVTVVFHGPNGSASNVAVDGKTYLAIHDRATTIDTAITSGSFGGGVNLVAGGAAANVQQRRVSAGYFAVLGVAPFMGREFSPDEDRAGGPPVAVISHGLWTRAFNSDPQIVGRPIMLRGEPYTVVGVMPATFTTGTAIPTDVWTPILPSTKGEGGGANYGMVARLRDGVAWAQANAETAQLGSAAAREGYPPQVTATCELIPFQQSETADIRQPLLMLWGAVGMVLLIACVNLAGLLIARSGMRTREIATRLALGSGRAAVVRQLLVESAVLALAGGALGVLVGAGVLTALKQLSADVFPVGYPVALDARVLAVTLAVALVTSVLFGLVPALHASRVDVQRSLAESGTRAVAGGRGRWPRRLLVVGEVALGVVLLVSAGLLVRTFVHLRQLNPGFDPTSVITASVSLQDARYKDAAKVDRLFTDTLDRIRRIAGVQAAGVALGLPYTRLLNLGFKPLDGARSGQGGNITNLSYATPGYLEALRIPLRAGRLIGEGDTSTSLPVAVVNEEFARRYYKDDGAIGRRIAVVGGAREIVGVVGNARATSSGFEHYSDPLVTPPIIYIPASQASAPFLNLVHTWFGPSWVVRASGPHVASGMRDAIAAVDPMLPIAKLETMTDVQDASLAPQRFMMALVVGLGAVALLLAAIGIHGLIASSVTERTRELGIRLALGATSAQVMQSVVVPGLILAAAGVLIGAGVALATVRLLQSFLWGVTPTDPLTFVVVIATLLAVALLASLVPALRVLRFDPALTLRAE